MKYDFLITYEIKNREIENVCLLKRELERRGYTVKICNMYSTFFETPDPIEAEVVVVSEYYFPHEKYYAASHVTEVKKLVDLRWEQVFSNSDEANPKCVNSLKEWGKDAVHIAWGSFPYQRMVNEWKMPKDHVKITGSITLDFLRGKLKNYYDNRETVFKRYGIPNESRTHLFISSLTVNDYHEKGIENNFPEEFMSSYEKFMKITRETQKILLDWFEKVLNEYPDDFIIYRPHPVEKGTGILKDLEKRNPRFRVISEESVKQWILICDKIYNWISTSIAEIYVSGKGCTMLRPVHIPLENDMRIFRNVDFVTCYEQFAKVFKENNQHFNIPTDNITQYYYIDKNRYSYELICDTLEEVYKNDKYLLKKPLENPFISGFINKEKVKNVIKRYVAKSRLMNYIYKHNIFKGTKFKYLLDDVKYTQEKLQKNIVTEKEIERIVNKINKALA